MARISMRGCLQATPVVALCLYRTPNVYRRMKSARLNARGLMDLTEYRDRAPMIIQRIAECSELEVKPNGTVAVFPGTRLTGALLQAQVAD